MTSKREELARIIDPDCWFREPRFRMRQVVALNKADAILDALMEPIEEETSAQDEIYRHKYDGQ